MRVHVSVCMYIYIGIYIYIQFHIHICMWTPAYTFYFCIFSLFISDNATIFMDFDRNSLNLVVEGDP